MYVYTLCTLYRRVCPPTLPTEYMCMCLCMSVSLATSSNFMPFFQYPNRKRTSFSSPSLTPFFLMCVTCLHCYSPITTTYYLYFLLKQNMYLLAFPQKCLSPSSSSFPFSSLPTLLPILLLPPSRPFPLLYFEEIFRISEKKLFIVFYLLLNWSVFCVCYHKIWKKIL